MRVGSAHQYGCDASRACNRDLAVPRRLHVAGPSPEVAAFTSVDKEFAEPVYQDFQSVTGIKVLPRYRPDSTQSAGLAEQIIERDGKPEGDVYWNGEILQTLRLDERGLLDEYPLPSDQDLPEMYRSPAAPGTHWRASTGIARQHGSRQKQSTAAFDSRPGR